MTSAEHWYREGRCPDPHFDVNLPGAALRVYLDGSSVWKTRKTLIVTPSIWDEVPDSDRVTIE